jgi:hypothetical protein
MALRKSLTLMRRAPGVRTFAASTDPGAVKVELAKCYKTHREWRSIHMVFTTASSMSVALALRRI